MELLPTFCVREFTEQPQLVKMHLFLRDGLTILNIKPGWLAILLLTSRSPF